MDWSLLCVAPLTKSRRVRRPSHPPNLLSPRREPDKIPSAAPNGKRRPSKKRWPGEKRLRSNRRLWLRLLRPMKCPKSRLLFETANRPNLRNASWQLVGRSAYSAAEFLVALEHARRLLRAHSQSAESWWIGHNQAKGSIGSLGAPGKEHGSHVSILHRPVRASLTGL